MDAFSSAIAFFDATDTIQSLYTNFKVHETTVSIRIRSQEQVHGKARCHEAIRKILSDPYNWQASIHTD